MVKKTKGVYLFVFGMGYLSADVQFDSRVSIPLPFSVNQGPGVVLDPKQGADLLFSSNPSKIVKIDDVEQKDNSRVLVSGQKKANQEKGQKKANHEKRKALYSRVKVVRREIDDAESDNKTGKCPRKEKRSFVYSGNIDVQFMYKNPSSYLIPLDSKTGKLVRSEADKFFNTLSSSGLQEALELLPSLSPNDVSYIIFKYRHLQKQQQNPLFFDRVKVLKNLEFDWNKFEALNEKAKECLLYNLTFPIKSAKFCLEDWEAGNYNINNIFSYNALSPVGLAWFFVLIQKHSSLKDYPELKGNTIYLEKVKKTLEIIRLDPRFPLKDYPGLKGNTIYLEKVNKTLDISQLDPQFALERYCPNGLSNAFSDALDAVYKLYGN